MLRETIPNTKFLSLKKIYNSELNKKLNKFSTYKKFSNRVKDSKKTCQTSKEVKNNNKKVISYGATYKSATVFNYCNIDSKLINYVIDNTKNKQGKYTPGKHLLIKPPCDMIKEKIDFAFLGAWNFLKK